MGVSVSKSHKSIDDDSFTDWSFNLNSTYAPQTINQYEQRYSSSESQAAHQPLTLTHDQQKAVQQIKEFALSDQSCFVLTGSAGTGKTTIIKQICTELSKLNIIINLCAPTGRASRILEQKTSCSASTIHSSIYTLDKLEVRRETEDENDPSLRYHFPLKKDQPIQGVWIIDESSMIGDNETKSDTLHFGSGRLLSDLLHYLRLDRESPVSSGMKVIFVGDPLQLPPVGTQHSALDLELLRSKLGEKPQHLHLDQVLRQAQDSGILSTATRLREAVNHKQLYRAKIEYNHDIMPISRPEVLHKLHEAYQQDLSCVAITYSNAEAYRIIRSMREKLFGNEEVPLQLNERLIVMKNHHSYNLSNGDQIKIVSSILESKTKTIYLKGSKAYHLKYIKVKVIDLSEPQRGIGIVWLLDNTLWLRDREEPAQLTQALIIDFEQRLKTYCNERRITLPKRGSRCFSDYLMSDPFFNALRVRFAYAMTCHKAQGGEWDEVMLKPKSLRKIKSESDAKWLYTGITRASKRLYIMNDEEVDLTQAQTEIPNLEARYLETTPPALPSSDPKPTQDLNPNNASNYILVNNLAKLSNDERILAKLKHSIGQLKLKVKSIQSLQYRYRVVFQEAKQSLQVDFNYNGKEKITKISSSVVETWGLTAQYINTFILVDSGHHARLVQKELELNDHMPNDQRQNDYTESLYQQVSQSIQRPLHQKQLRLAINTLYKSGMIVTKAQSEPYALSLYISGPLGEGRISFFHNSKDQWTQCRAISQSPTSLKAVEQFI